MSSFYHYLILLTTVVILDQGAVKAFGTYDELRVSGVDIDDFVPRATEEELAEMKGITPRENAADGESSDNSSVTCLI